MFYKFSNTSNPHALQESTKAYALQAKSNFTKIKSIEFMMQNISIFSIYLLTYITVTYPLEKNLPKVRISRILYFSGRPRLISEGNGLKSTIKTAAPKIATIKPSTVRIADDVSEQQTTKSSAK